MITVGIDLVEIERCKTWSSFASTKLERLFSKEEIAYCLFKPAKAAERFAVRYAAKEALFKALTPLLTKPVPFLTLVRHASIIHSPLGNPLYIIDWKALSLSPADVQLSLTHTKTVATAIVLIEQNN